MLTAAGSPLVAGSVVSERNMAIRKVKAVRSFMWDRKAVKVGETVDLPDHAAFEVVWSKKAEYVEAPAPVAVAEPETNAPKGRGSKKDAG